MWRRDQDPYGTAMPIQNPAAQGIFVYNLRVPWQYYDAETGLSQNYFRDLDSQTGRYAESDPIGLWGGSLSTYAYVKSAPVSHSDFFGLRGGMGIVGSGLNEALQDIPDTICDIWPAACISKLRVCTEARCKHVGPCGKVWYDITREWQPTQPTPEEVTKVNPDCVCTKWKLRNGE